MERQAFIRPYDSTDFADVIHVFRETCDPSLKIEPLETIGSYLWCRPYLFLSPKTCFVVDDGQGRAVGYILSTPDTASFCHGLNSMYVPKLDVNLYTLPISETSDGAQIAGIRSKQKSLLDGLHNDQYSMVYSSFSEPLKGWPGHLHIDILPSHQRMGFGKKLLDTLMQNLRSQSCTGVYLGMVASNEDAGRFYEANDFRRLPFVLDDGVSGEKGRTKASGGGSGTIYYVKDI